MIITNGGTSTVVDTLIIKRDGLFKAVIEHFALIVELCNWLSPPIRETLTPQQIASYSDLIVTYTERLHDLISQLTGVLFTLANYGYTDSTEGILTQLDAIRAAVNRLLTKLSIDVTEAVSTPTTTIINEAANVSVDVKNTVEVKVEGINKDFIAMTGAVFDSFSKPSKEIAAALEELTIAGFGMMFSILIDSIADRLSGWVNNAVGS